MNKLDITIPILNEEATLDAQICKIVEFVDANLSDTYQTQIVIADNGSTDRSPEIGEQLERRFPSVKYLRVGERGVGRALKFSWSQSHADIVGYMDLDLATDLKHLPEAVQILADGDAHIVAGSRLAKGAKVIGRKPLRGVTSRVFNGILSAYMGAKFSDGMCGFKFLKRNVLEDLMQAGATSNGWFFSTQLLLCAEHLNLHVNDLPVTWTDDPNSKVQIIKLAREYVGEMRSLKQTLKDA